MGKKYIKKMIWSCCVIFVVIGVICLVPKSPISEEPESFSKTLEVPEQEEEVSELEEVSQITWEELEALWPKLQKALWENPNLNEFEGRKLEISENRVLILDGYNTECNVDYPEPDKFIQAVPNEDSSWICMLYSNKIFYVPEWYDGKLHEYKETYIDKNGTESIVTYEVPYISYEKTGTGERFTTVKRIINVNVYAPFNEEKLHFLEKFTFGKSEKYFLDIPNPEFSKFPFFIWGVKNNRALLYNEYVLAVFDISNKEMKVLTSDALEYNMTETTVEFVENNVKYSCNWTENSNIVKMD